MLRIQARSDDPEFLEDTAGKHTTPGLGTFTFKSRRCFCGSQIRFPLPSRVCERERKKLASVEHPLCRGTGLESSPQVFHYPLRARAHTHTPPPAPMIDRGVSEFLKLPQESPRTLSQQRTLSSLSLSLASPPIKSLESFKIMFPTKSQALPTP